MKIGSCQVKLTLSIILPFACSTRVKKKKEGKREDCRIFEWHRIYQA